MRVLASENFATSVTTRRRTSGDSDQNGNRRISGTNIANRESLNNDSFNNGCIRSNRLTQREKPTRDNHYAKNRHHRKTSRHNAPDKDQNPQMDLNADGFELGRTLSNGCPLLNQRIQFRQTHGACAA
jgi:hypothetical protein